ncbi:hypothetical protein BOX15_Mlig003390g1 [Macrostomum lignano]|uniref:Uncharacterized protein n=2 Tax=Macrostomum lignano TaxID=282301 RepID=A0A267F8C1_9PLAT|nr:hypothetical protein BOX15_Mlig003390g1 [Macrostomum lignano]
MSSFKGGGGRPTGPSQQDLQAGPMRNLLDQQVVSMRHVKRPLGSSGVMPWPFSHSGTEAVTADGKHWLIHKGGKKGSDFGREKGGNTVVTDAKNMSGAWRTTGCVGGGWTDTKPGTRVTDLVKTGGKDYNLLFSNCHFAARNAAKFAAEKK